MFEIKGGSQSSTLTIPILAVTRLSTHLLQQYTTLSLAPRVSAIKHIVIASQQIEASNTNT